MNNLRRLLRNVPVLRFGAASILAVLIATSALLGTPMLLAPPALAADAPVGAPPAFSAGTAAPFAASPGAAPALPPGVTPQQAEAAKKAIQSGAPLPPAAQKILESRPDLKEQVPPELREKLKAQEQEKGQETEPGRKPAARPESAAAGAAAESATAVVRYDWRRSAYVGNLFSSRLTDPEKESLTHFGHELFTPTVGASQLPGTGQLAGAAHLIENMPVSPGYVVGPGDEIIVKMWGRVEGIQRMVVDRDGKIFFPKFGALNVAGKTFEEMRAYLKAKVSTIAEVSSDVAMGQMKGIRISVVGEVRAPGWYNVSSQHSALQALSIAGGMKDIGSLRRISMLRGGKAVQEIDLYDFLLSGDARADIRLLQGDVIFVPVVGRLVAVVGEVRRPAIYELRDEKSLLDLVRIAGGFTPSAWKQRVQVERLEGNVSRIVLDASVGDLEQGKLTLDLSDGDIVRVFPIVAADVNVVTLEGNVVRPGRFELKPGMTVGGLFKDATDFLPETYYDYALLTRMAPPDLQKEILSVNLREIVLEKKAGADIPLMPQDRLVVYNRSAFKDSSKVTISGDVRRPGSFDLKKGFRVSDLVKLAGDVTKTSFLPRAEIVRIDAKRAFRTIYFDLGQAMAGDEKENHLLEDEDQVRVHSLWETQYRKTVSVSGDVNQPGEQVLTEGMRLSDLLFKAGGFRESAYTKEAELVRRQLTDNGVLMMTEAIVVHPDKVLAGEKDADLPLRQFDQLTVRAIPTWGLTYDRTVTASGDLRAPGTFVLTTGMKLSDLLFRAGGFKESTYTKEAELVRRQLTDNGTLMTTEAIVVYPERALAGEKEADLPLRQYDQLTVRAIPTWGLRYDRTVTASGDLRAPGAFVLTAGMKLSDLLFRAGGFKESAYTKEAELVRRGVTPEGDLVKTETMIVYPDKALAGDPAANLALKENDLVIVRQIPDWSEKLQVTLSGEVQFPGTYAVRKGERLSSVVQRAGGFTRDAYLKAAQFTRVSTQKTQQEAIDKLISDLELEVAQKGQQIGGSLDKEDVDANKELLAARRSLIDQLKKTKAKGRVIIRLAGQGKLEGTVGDVLLENGDQLEVPRKMNVVNVVGRVYNPTGVMYDPARDSVGYYLRLVGGPTESADRDHIFLLKADGSVVTRETADTNFFAFAGGGLMNARVEPGDSILVPEKVVQVRFMKDVKDITQILYQIAVTAGVLILAF